MNNTKHINKIEYHYTVIEIAGIVIKICTDLPQIKSFYQKFESNKRPVLSINVTEKDIEEENRKHNFWTYECQRKIITQKELDIETVFIDNGNKRSIENTVMCRKIAEELLNLNVFLMHGAAISLDNNTIIFTAPSGIGKTTHIQKWLDHFPDAFVVNGDKPFIRISHDNLSPPLACGSPWAGKRKQIYQHHGSYKSDRLYGAVRRESYYRNHVCTGIPVSPSAELSSRRQRQDEEDTKIVTEFKW